MSDPKSGKQKTKTPAQPGKPTAVQPSQKEVAVKSTNKPQHTEKRRKWDDEEE